jgi:hypothetical protein
MSLVGPIRTKSDVRFRAAVGATANTIYIERINGPFLFQDKGTPRRLRDCDRDTGLAIGD